MLNKKDLENLVKKSRYKKRGVQTAIYAEIDGEIKSLKEWAKFFGMGYQTLLYRYNKGITGRALIKPPRKKLNNFL